MQNYGQCFIPLVLMHQSNHYTQVLHYNIPSDWVSHNLLLVYIDSYRWHKSIAHFSSIHFSNIINTQVIFYDGHDSHFDDRAVITKENLYATTVVLE